MEVFTLLKKRPYGFIGAVILLLVILLAVFAPVIATQDPNMIRVQERSQPPSSRFLFGTDEIGRDIFSRFVYGSRPYLEVGLMTLGITVGLSLVLALISSLASGRIQKFLRALVYSVSIISIVVVFVAFYGLIPSRSLLIYITFTEWFPQDGVKILIEILASLIFLASIYRTLSNPFRNDNLISQRKWKWGGSHWAAYVKQVLPVLLVMFFLAVGSGAALFVPLSSYGLGLAPPTPEWGSIITSSGLSSTLMKQNYAANFGGIAFFVTTVGTVLFALATREVWLPKRFTTPQPEKVKGSEQPETMGKPDLK
ncbi:MAG: hypothetical protein PHE50_09580 [Dehalococcoidales bacterium]|nr:hypothetical protein [Dehalococcoidales bacterium]